jgi:hypothetical protein
MGIRFWVYENWTHKRGRIHRSDCVYCNDGRGVHGSRSGRNDRWHGPFTERNTAVGFAERLTQPNTKACDICEA